MIKDYMKEFECRTNVASDELLNYLCNSLATYGEVRKKLNELNLDATFTHSSYYVVVKKAILKFEKKIDATKLYK